MNRILKDLNILLGQEEGSEALADDFVYPSMDELADQVSFSKISTCIKMKDSKSCLKVCFISPLKVNEVINHLAIVRYVGIGVGLGGNVLIRHSLQVLLDG